MYKEKIIDTQTGKEIIKDYTPEQLAEAEKEQAAAQARIIEMETRLKIRQSALAKLAALGLTEDEIAAL